MLKYLLTFIFSAVVGLFALEIAENSTGNAMSAWHSYVLPLIFGLTGMGAIFLSRHDAILIPQVKARLEQGTFFWAMVLITAIAGFMVFFLEDFAEEPIPEPVRFLINSFAFASVVLSVLMHLIKRHMKRREKTERKGDMEV